MLGKLFKYDFKELGAFYLPIYLIYAGITAAFAILTALAMNSSLQDNEVFSLLFGIIAFVFGLSVTAFVLFSGLILVYYFYRKFVSEEAYLTMTLPVDPWKHIVSKLLSGAVWRLFTWIVFAVSVFLILLVTGVWEAMGNSITFNFVLRSIWSELRYEFGFSGGTVALCVIYGVITLLTSPLIYFASISIGQMAKKHKVLMSVGAFVIINIVISFLMANISILQLQNSSAFSFLILAIIECIITSVIYFGITVYFLGKELNLE